MTPRNRLTEAWNGTTTAQFYYDWKNRQIRGNINGKEKRGAEWGLASILRQ